MVRTGIGAKRCADSNQAKVAPGMASEQEDLEEPAAAKPGHRPSRHCESEPSSNQVQNERKFLPLGFWKVIEVALHRESTSLDVSQTTSGNAAPHAAASRPAERLDRCRTAVAGRGRGTTFYTRHSSDSSTSSGSTLCCISLRSDRRRARFPNSSRFTT